MGCERQMINICCRRIDRHESQQGRCWRGVTQKNMFYCYKTAYWFSMKTLEVIEYPLKVVPHHILAFQLCFNLWNLHFFQSLCFTIQKKHLQEQSEGKDHLYTSPSNVYTQVGGAPLPNCRFGVEAPHLFNIWCGSAAPISVERRVVLPLPALAQFWRKSKW